MKFWSCAYLAVLPSGLALSSSSWNQQGDNKNVTVSQKRPLSIVFDPLRSGSFAHQDAFRNSSSTRWISAAAGQPRGTLGRVGDAAKEAFENRSLRAGLEAASNGSLEASIPPFLDTDEMSGHHAISSVHGIARHIIMPGTSIVLLSIMIGAKLSHYEMTAWIPESAITLIVAILFGEMLGLLVSTGLVSAESFVLASSSILNLFLLPIIIFVSGWSLRRGDFLFQLDYIIIFAVLGTLISTFAIGFLSYACSAYLNLHVVKDLRSNMAFAALISAVDPVASLVTFKELKVEPLLNIMVLGESTINDAVAVVVFNIINEHWDDFGWGHNALYMVELLFGSMIFGLCIALVLIYLMRICKLADHTHMGIMFIVFSAYFIFAFAESTHLFSGIIANLIAGIVFSAYARPQFEIAKDSEKDWESTDFFLDTIGSAADHLVFVLCGASTALITSVRGVKFGIVSIILCLVGRALAVLPCGLIANQLKQCTGDKNILTRKHLFMMWHAGLRGGIALLLALQIDADWCEFKATIVNGTFMTICFLLLVNGGSTHFCLTKLGIPMGAKVIDVPWDSLHNKNKGPVFEKFVQMCLNTDESLRNWLVLDSKKEDDAP